MGLHLIMLQHEVKVAADEWQDNGPEDLVTFKLPSIKCFISLSVAYACLYHNPSNTMGDCFHNTDISKLFIYLTNSCCLPSAQCSVNIYEENSSPKSNTPSKVRRCSLKLVTAVRSRPQQTLSCTILRWFLTVQ